MHWTFYIVGAVAVIGGIVLFPDFVRHMKIRGM